MGVSSGSDLQNILSEKFGKEIRIDSVDPVGGGCINETSRIKTNKGIYFGKWNDAGKFPSMLEAEAKGLQLLKEAGEIKVPDVIVQKTIGAVQYLILEWTEGAGQQKHFWYGFGKSLAKLHRHSSDKFGLDHNNYIGSLSQSNNRHSNWSEFFILERLEPQVRLARDNGRAGNPLSQKFSRLFSQLDSVFPPERPALLHGDLWSGNFMTGRNGEPVIIDPAVYYGHREMDLGMTRLFGGFPREFYESYHEEFPLESKWKERTDICNLYPLMVHVNLFGGGYLQQVESILGRF